MFSAARKSLRLWQSMTFFIGWELSGHFTYRYPSDSCPQTLEITLGRITASSFLESSISLMSVAFEGCNFVATFHYNFSYGCILYIDALINAPVYSLFWPELADPRSKGLWEYRERLSLGEGLLCAFPHFKLHWSITVISLASVVPANQFRLKRIYCFFSLRRRKLSTCFRSLWSILYHCGILDGWLWLVILLNTRSLIGYLWSVILYALKVWHLGAIADAYFEEHLLGVFFQLCFQ